MDREIEIIKVLDPRLAFNGQSHKVLALNGASYINSVAYPVNSLSQSSIVIQCNPASANVAVDSNFLLHMGFTITVTGTNTSEQPLLIPSMFGPSFLPIRKIITSEALAINGTVSQIQNPHLFFPQMVGSYDAKMNGAIDGEWSTTPSFPDQSTDFLQLPQSAFSLRNPLASAYDQTLITPRSAFAGFQVVSNDPGATSATFTLDCAEALIMSPLHFGDGSFESIAMTNINNLLYTANIANLNKVLSIAYPVDPLSGLPTYLPVPDGMIEITNVQVSVNLAELLIFQYSLTPDVPRPIKLINGYSEVIDYNTTSQQPLRPGGSATLTLANQTFGSVPRSVYIFVPSQPDSFTQTSLPSACTATTSYLQFGGAGGFVGNSSFHPLSINFNNVTQSQTFNMYDLYKIAKKNGCVQDFTEFVGLGGQGGYSNGVGTMLKLNFGEDIVLGEDGISVGTTGKFNFTCQLSVYNQTNHTLDAVTLHAVVVYDGYQTINADTQTQNHQASFSAAEVMRIPLNPEIKFKPVRQIFGGSFWNKLKSFVAPIGKLLKSTGVIGKHAHMIPGVGSQVGAVARALGFGYRRAPSRKAGASHGRSHKRGMRIAGRSHKRSSMKHGGRPAGAGMLAGRVRHRRSGGIVLSS